MKNLIFVVLPFVFFLSVFNSQGQGTKSAADQMPTMHKAGKTITPDTYKGPQIRIGSGGGVTGASTTYYLLDTGQLFGRRSRDVTFTLIGQQTAANTKRVFTSVEINCKIKTTKFSNPGNVYKFVQWRKGKEKYKVTWGAVGKAVPANYPKVYDSFMAMIPASLQLK